MPQKALDLWAFTFLGTWFCAHKLTVSLTGHFFHLFNWKLCDTAPGCLDAPPADWHETYMWLMKSLTKLLELCVLLCSDPGNIWLPGPGGKNIGKEELLSAWDHRRLGIIPNRSLASLSYVLATNYQPLDFMHASIYIWNNCHEWLLGTLDCETLFYCKQIVTLNTVNLYCQQKSLKDIMQDFFSVWIRQTHTHLRTEEQTKGIELARQALYHWVKTPMTKDVFWK